MGCAECSVQAGRWRSVVLAVAWLCSIALSGCGGKTAMLKPDPLSVALTVGQWVLKDKKRLYLVSVEASGKDAETARAACFRIAVAQAVGSLVLSELELKNGKVARQDYLQYSAGYVEDYKVKSEDHSGEKVRVVMDVWVSGSQIADRLQLDPDLPGKIAGKKAAAQQKTYIDQLHAGDRLIDRLTHDFPIGAFVSRVTRTEVRRHGRHQTLVVYARVEWQEKYVDALAEALEQTAEGHGSRGNTVTAFGEEWGSTIHIQRKSEWFGTNVSYRDGSKTSILYRNLMAPRLKLRLMLFAANDKPISTHCYDDIHFSGRYYGPGSGWFYFGNDAYGYPLGQFYAAGTPYTDIGIYGAYESSAELSVSLGEGTSALDKLTRAQVNVVRDSECEPVVKKSTSR